jgi:hypothetical protein
VPDRATQRPGLLSFYTTPIERIAENNILLIQPQLNSTDWRPWAAADQARSQQPFWVDFWNYLWGRPTAPTDIPLRANFSENRLRTYLLEQISSRYDQPPTPAMPAVGTVQFQAGQEGSALDIDRSISLIENALKSTSRRAVDLPLQRTQPSRPSFQNLEVLLKQTLT